MLIQLGNYVKPILHLMRWHQPVGILLLLSPTLWALVVAARGFPDTDLVIIFILGTVLMRSAGCVINDLWDRDLDGKVARTRTRPLAQGLINPLFAVGLAIFLILCAGGLLLLLNNLVLLLAIVGVIGTIFYPTAKRFLPVPQLVLALVFAWGVPTAYAAQAAALPPLAWLLYLLNGIWIIAYDTQYALRDRADDEKISIHSSALYFGEKTPLVIVLCQLALVLGLLLFGCFLDLAFGYFLLLGLGTCLFVYHWFLTRGYKDTTACLLSFRENHWFGWLILSGFFLGFDAAP